MPIKNKPVSSCITVAAMAMLLAVVYHIFIVQNHFAPAGLNGIATMVQYKTGFSISYMSLIINVPLSIFAYFFIEKKFAVRTLIFSVVYSFTYLFLQKVGWEFMQYNAEGHDTIYPVIISGAIAGFVYGICMKNNACTGGTDVLSRYINKVKPETNFFMVTFVLNALVAVASLFVYSEGGTADYKPVALCITYCFISNFTGNYIIKGTKTAYKFTIVTTHPDEIVAAVTHELGHSATKLDAVGTYTNTEKSVLLCVVNRHQLIDFRDIISQYDDTFAFYELVNETYGNFVHIKK
ncbi:MAG: YitT family protein [Oscillospiraceae bacterium]|nr:YitT family protein [Oscillospiraceae bacterium]